MAKSDGEITIRVVLDRSQFDADLEALRADLAEVERVAAGNPAVFDLPGFLRRAISGTWKTELFETGDVHGRIRLVVDFTPTSQTSMEMTRKRLDEIHRILGLGA